MFFSKKVKSSELVSAFKIPILPRPKARSEQKKCLRKYKLGTEIKRREIHIEARQLAN